MMPVFYTVPETAKLAKVNSQTVRRWLRDGALRGHRVGGKDWRVREEDLIAFLSGGVDR